MIKLDQKMIPNYYVISFINVNLKHEQNYYCGTKFPGYK
jgi:hypothetical protein